MNAIGIVALIFVVIGWVGGVAAWAYFTYHIIVGWFRPGNGYKALRGVLGFFGCAFFAAFNGLIGGWFGGWQAAIH